MENENKKKVNGKRIALIILCVILAIVLVALIVVTVFMDRLFGSINRVPDNQETLSSSEIEDLRQEEGTLSDDYTGPVFGADEITLPTETVEVIETDKVVNILVIGSDRRGGTFVGMTDALILCSFNRETKTLTMTSFLRDMYVDVPGWHGDKINIAYAVGGFETLNATLEKNFGVKVDGNVAVDFGSFKKVIDLLGGIDIQLTGREAAHLREQGFYWYDAGMNHLNGEGALAYSRIRYIDNDFYRTNRQRTVITAVLNQFKNASLSQITDTLVSAFGIIITDMTDQEILGYAMEFAPMLKDMNIVSQHIPVEGTFTYGGVKEFNLVDCIIVKDFETNIALIADVLDG